MHWREGFRRLARGTAVAFAAAAIVATGSEFTSTLNSEVYKARIAHEERVRLSRMYEGFRVIKVAEPPPVSDHYRKAGQAALNSAIGWGIAYAVLWAVFRGLRWVGRGFLDGDKPQTGGA